MLALSLVLVKNGQESFDLGLGELLLDFFRAEKFDLHLGSR